jgi:disulfide bond formation protein DsbB
MDDPLVRNLISISVMILTGIAVVFMRRFADPEKLRENNEFTGFSWAFIGLVYGVYLAFMVVVVWQNFDNADSTATSEATHLSSLWRDVQILPGGDQLQKDLLLYARSVVADDWPAMGRGEHGSQQTQVVYENLWRTFYAMRPSSNDVVHNAFYQEALHHLNELGRERRMRLLSGSADLPFPMWLLLIAGGVAMVGFALCIGTPQRWLQITLTCTLAGFLTYSILMVGALEEPYSGDIHVKPDAFVSVIQSFEQRK